MKIKNTIPLLITSLLLISSCKTDDKEPVRKNPNEETSITIDIEGKVEEQNEGRYIHLQNEKDADGRVYRVKANFTPGEAVPAIAYIYNDKTGDYVATNITFKTDLRSGKRLTTHGRVNAAPGKTYNKLSIYIGLTLPSGSTRAEDATFTCGSHTYSQSDLELNKEVILVSEGNDLRKLAGSKSDASAMDLKFTLAGVFFMAKIQNESGAKQKIGAIQLHGFGAGGVKVAPPTSTQKAPRLVAIQSLADQDYTNYQLQDAIELENGATAMYRDQVGPFVRRFAIYAPLTGKGWLEARAQQGNQFVPLDGVRMQYDTPRPQTMTAVLRGTTICLLKSN